MATYPDGKRRNLQGVEGLIITGVVGSGKTHMAVGISNAVSAFAPVRFASALQVVERAKECINNPMAKPFELERFDGVVFLDDLSAIRPTDFALDTLDKIIRRRYDEAMPLIVTTHSAHTDLASMFGAAIASRLLELGKVVKLTGNDRRTRKLTRLPTEAA